MARDKAEAGKILFDNGWSFDEILSLLEPALATAARSSNLPVLIAPPET